METVDGNTNPTDREIIEFLNMHKKKSTVGVTLLAQRLDEGFYKTVFKQLFK